MKIAFLTSEYPHPKTGNSGGIGTSIKNLAIGLLAKGCSVRVLVYGQQKEGVFDDNGIVVQQIKNIKLKGFSWWLTRKKIERIINQLYQNKEIDLVEAPDWTGITSFIKPKKCPIVIRLNGSDTYFCHLDQRPVKWINKFHEKRALKKADALLSVSQFTADLTNQVFDLHKEFTIIPNSIDTALFSENSYVADFKSLLGTNVTKQFVAEYRETPNILYFGTLIRKKGLLELPLIFNKVIEQYPLAKLVLVGKDASDIISRNSSTWKMMKSLFSMQALKNVTYLGSVPYPEIQTQIKQATVCVFPSFAEALPVSWIEAMALEKPIVASNVGWASEVIDDGVDGYLVPPTNHIEYANKIVKLLENKDLQKIVGVEARKKVIQRFSIEIVAQQSLKFYKKLIH